MIDIRSISFLILLATLSLLFDSCGSSANLYEPQHDMPHTLSSKGELKGTVNLYHFKHPRFQASIAYSPIKNIGISYGRFFGHIQSGNSGAIGFYSNKKSKQNTFHFYDIYAGYAENKNISYRYEQFFNDKENKIIASYSKYFVQIGHHYQKKEMYFDNYLGYSKLAFRSITSFETDFKINEKIEMIRTNNIFNNLEATSRIGIKKGKFNFYLGTSLRGSLTKEPLPNETITFFSGVNFCIFN